MDAAPLSPVTFVSPVSEFDLNLDGKVSVRYLHHAIQQRRAQLNRMQASNLSSTAEDLISDRLRRNYASETWCAQQRTWTRVRWR